MNAILTTPPQGISLENAMNILKSLNFNIVDVKKLKKEEKEIPNQETKEAMAEAERLIKDKDTPFFDDVDAFLSFTVVLTNSKSASARCSVSLAKRSFITSRVGT